MLFLPLIMLIFFNVSPAQTQLELNRQSCAEYDKADTELNRIYQMVLREYKSDGLFVERIKQAQRAWIVYRDAHLESLFPLKPNDNPAQKYGSVYPVCRCNALARITRQRTTELKEWINGVEEGDVCAGSIKVREKKPQDKRRRVKKKLK